MTTVGRIVPWICLVLAGCGGPAPQAPEAQPPAAETAFDDMLDKKREIPQAIENAQMQRFEEQRRQIDGAETDAPPK